MHENPHPQHAWLQRLVGTWTYETPHTTPEGETHTVTGRETVRLLGDLWVVLNGHGEMPGGHPAEMMLTLGFNPKTGRYVGTWVGSMMTHLWVYDGELDEAQRVLTLHCKGPNFMSGDDTLVDYKDVIELVNENERTLTAFFRGEDGEWKQMMQARYRRQA